MPLQRLDDLDEQYVNVNLDDDDFSRAEHPHQADALNITLVDNFESGLEETDVSSKATYFNLPFFYHLLLKKTRPGGETSP